MSPTRMSRIETTVRVVIAFNEAFNRHDIVAMMKLVSDDCVYESATAPDGEIYTGKEEVEGFWRAYMSRDPHIQIVGEDVFGLGFRTIWRWKAEWETEPGIKQYVRGVDIFHVIDGLIRKQYSYVKG